MASDYDACGPVPFEAPHRTKPGLEAPVVSLDPVVGILGGVVQCGRQEVRDHADQGVGPVSGDLGRLTVRADRSGVRLAIPMLARRWAVCSSLTSPLGERKVYCRTDDT